MSTERWIDKYECLEHWGYHHWLPSHEEKYGSVMFCSRCATTSSIDVCIGTCGKAIDPRTKDSELERDTIYVWHVGC